MSTSEPSSQKKRRAEAAVKREREIALRPMAPIVPPVNVSGRALIIVIAIMSFLSCVTLGAVTMVQETATAWQGDISREITIQVKPADGLDINAALESVRETALAFPGTRSASIIGKDATARLLEPWLGEGFNLDELPVPRLVIVTIDETSPPDFAAMREQLSQTVPTASLDDHRAWSDRLVAMARLTVLAGAGVLVLIFAATVLTVVFATRGALAGNRHIVEVLHFVGAETGYIATEFQRRFLLIGLRGAALGGSVAGLSFLALSLWQKRAMATPLADQANALFGNFALSTAGYLGIFLIMAMIAAMTAFTTRFTVVRTVAEIDRMRADPSLAELG